MKNFIIGVLVLVLLGTPNWLCAQELSAIDACSIFDVAKFNAESWESGDVLVRIVKSFDNVDVDGKGNPKGAQQEDEMFYRLKFDFKKKRGIGLVFARQETVDMSNPHIGEPAAKTVSSYYGTSLDGPAETILQFDSGGVSKHKKSTFPGDFESTLADLGVFELRGYWMSEGGSKSSFLETIDFYLAGNQYLKRDDDSGNTTLHFKGKWANSTRILRYRFDAESQMPVSFSLKFDDINGKKNLVESASGKFKWQQLKNVNLPKRLEFTRKVELQINHERQEGEQNTVVDFHWFAFNDEDYTNEDLDEAKCFESKEKFFASVDPAKIGVSFDQGKEELKEANGK